MITKMNQITKWKMVSPELFVQELICCSCHKKCKISEGYWTGFGWWRPPANWELLSGNILDVMKALFLGHHFRPPFQSPCYWLGALYSLLMHISLWRGGEKERREQYRRGWETNPYDEVPCCDACLVTLHGHGQALLEAPMKIPEVEWALGHCFQPWWDTGLSWLYSPEARVGTVKMPSMPIGPCPKGLAVWQRFGRCAFNLC